MPAGEREQYIYHMISKSKDDRGGSVDSRNGVQNSEQENRPA